MRGLVVLILLLPAVSADVEFTDPAGDVRYEDPAGQSHAAAQQHGAIDIIRAWIGSERRDTFEVGFETLDASDPITLLGPSAPQRFMLFDFDGLTYRVRPQSACGEAGAPIELLSLSGEFVEVGCGERVREDAVHRVHVPKAVIVDSAGVPARAGSLIEGFRVEGWQWLAGSLDLTEHAVWARDDAPDLGGAPAFQLVNGSDAFGAFHIATPSAIRASNGGPDTFLYTVLVENRGDPDTLLISHGDLPDGWLVRLPARVAAPSGQVAFPVIVTTTSSHAHGDRQTFPLLMQSIQSEVSMEVQLGIQYLEIPQLAGHHPTLFIHAGEPSYSSFIGQTSDRFWFNTVADDDRRVDVPLEADERAVDGTAIVHRWFVPMDPSLLIGMDFDVEGIGTLDIAIDAPTPASTATFQPRLWHCQPEDAAGERAGTNGCDLGSWFLLAEGEPQTRDLPSGSTSFTADLLPTNYADLVPYVQGSNIELEVILHTDTPSHAFTSGPRLAANGSRMDLPLLEYKDPLDASFEEAARMALRPGTPFEHAVNPGATTWFPFTLHNTGDRTVQVQLDVVGQNAAWAAWVPAGPLTLEADQEKEIVLGVTAPHDAPVGALAELFAIAEEVDDPTSVALSKVRAVVTDEPLPKETPPGEPGSTKNSPGLVPGLLLGALAVLVRRR